MPAPQEQEMESWRILLFARNGSKMLLFRDASGFHLPELRIPRWQRIAANLNAEAKRVWQLDTVALFPLTVNPGNGASPACMYHVMEVRCAEELAPFALDCLTVSDLNEDSFADPIDFLAVRAMQFEGALCKEPPEAFAEFGSFDRLFQWVRSQLQSADLRWNGPFCQLQASTSFALIRFDTDSGAVWFKAVGKPNVREFLITTTLAARFPTYVPEILATHEASNGWLMREAAGVSLLQTADISNWQKAAVSLAELQIASISRSDELLATGSHDVRSHKLKNRMQSFFALARCLMRQQTKPTPPPVSDAALCQLERDLDRVLERLKCLDIPDALGNLDCNPGNIIVSSPGCAFLDWAEAYVGNPFFTFHYLLGFLRQAVPNDPDAERSLIAAYTLRWEGILDAKQIHNALKLTSAPAAFAYATTIVAQRVSSRAEELRIAALLRSLVRRIRREIDEPRLSEMLA
jgi:hypothetical protein